MESPSELSSDGFHGGSIERSLMGPLGGKSKHRDMEDTHIFLVGAFVVSRAANNLKMLPAQPIGFIAMCGPWSNVFGPHIAMCGPWFKLWSKKKLVSSRTKFRTCCPIGRRQTDRTCGPIGLRQTDGLPDPLLLLRSAGPCGPAAREARSGWLDNFVTRTFKLPSADAAGCRTDIVMTHNPISGMSRYCIFRYRVIMTRYRVIFHDIGPDIVNFCADIVTISCHTRSLPYTIFFISCPISCFFPISDTMSGQYRDIPVSCHTRYRVFHRYHARYGPDIAINIRIY